MACLLTTSCYSLNLPVCLCACVVCQDLIARFHNPWEELTFIHAGQGGKERVFSQEEDR